MRENIYFYFMHIQVLFILSLVLLWFNTTIVTFLGYQLAAAEGNASYKCIGKERQALVDFKARSHDPHDELSTWRPEEEADCCQWSGVTCDTQTGHVTALDLSDCALGGEIRRHSLLNLTYLYHLDLSSNTFRGNILEFIDSITHLTYLNLGENQFTGTIPESIGNMTILTELYLYGNNFSGTIPMSIGSLTNLEYLDLSFNSFHGTIPPEFGNLTNLRTLDLIFVGSCIVENFDWLSSLSNLKDLNMDGISLAKANNWVNVILGLKNLVYISLTECDLSQVMHPYSSSVNSSSSIDLLHLDNNNLNSSMYPWLCPLIVRKFTVLSLSGNKFDGKLLDFLNNLSRCTSGTLGALDVSSNQFTGSLSDEIQNFSSLVRLNLSSNLLDGTISDKLWELPWLDELDLSSNSLTGAISEKIVKSNLSYIDLSYNSLEGAIFYDDVSNLAQSIQYIDFSSNKLGPRFPKWIQKLKILNYLDLSNNSISDTVSTAYWNRWKSSQLAYLDLSFNNISGKLPKSLSNHDLEYIDLSFNCFYGSIPAFPAGISFLDLSRNKFHGGISSLCQMYEVLEFLDLSSNSLTGKLTDCLHNLTYLKALNLGHNSLSGSIPPSVGYLGQLETLSLYNNSFSGELPLSLKNCTKLSLLDLGANKFYGNIPVWIGKNLSRLYALSLKSNKLFGTIPSQLCQLVSLQILDLSFNKLHGTIPSCVNNLTSLVQKGLFLDHSAHHHYISVDFNTYGRDVDDSYIDHLMIQWQGKINEFTSNLGFVKSIDLSSNSLTGEIPYEITDLQGLVALNLSHNSLLGGIPNDIGHMKELQTLDLSKNNLSRELPSSMSQLNFLNFLDVSYNNLSGRIPSGTQLQTFEPARYIGNVGLCGSPLPKKCPGDEELDEQPHTIGKNQGDEEGIERWFYIGGASGFATGFWIVCSALLLNRRWRHAFFRLHDSLKDWVYVKVVVFLTKWQRVVRA